MDNEPDKHRRIEEAKRLSLDMLAEGGGDDIRRIRAEAKSELAKGKKPDKNNRLLEQTAPLVEQRSQVITLPASTSWLDAIPANRKRLIRLTTASRLIIGMANGVLENAGLTLHRFFGIPCIPGSASKGRARDASEALPDQQPLKLSIFGNDHSEKKHFQQGAVCFLPAYPTSKDAALELDILTPHYPKYYTGNGNPNAEDIEGPNPQVFLTVAAGVEFLFPLVVMNPRLEDPAIQAGLDGAEACLRHALLHLGIGAKTSAGYGFFREGGERPFVPRNDLFPDTILPEPPPPPPVLTPEEIFIAKWRGQVSETIIRTGSFLTELAALVGDDAARQASIVEDLLTLEERKALANPVTKPKGFELLRRLNLLPPRRP